jgi:ribosomal RNA-processing protein 12
LIDHLNEATLSELLSTLDLFLTSPSREIVRSVLGFVKVSIISLPTALILPRLQTLVPNLMSWSREHKAQFKAKVKHIVERLIRRFGVETIDKFTPEADKKLIQNIRKTRERNKRRKQANEDGSDGSDDENVRRKGRFESEYDEAIYDSSSASEDDAEEDGSVPRKRGTQGRGTYIVEDEDEPLDLLSKKALANVSSTRPLRPQRANGIKKSKAKVNIDGKLVIGMDNDQHEGNTAEEVPGGDEGEGVGAYVDAVAGKDAVQRGQKGKLKFKKQRGVDTMEVDEEEVLATREASRPPRSQGRGGISRSSGGRGGRAGPRDFKQMRRGLGVGKTRGGRVRKVERGRRR